MSRSPRLLLTLLWLAVLCGSNAVPRAQESTQPFVGFLEAVAEPLTEPPYEQEMVLLTIRGFYPRNMAGQTLEQPAFRDVGWMQLGNDTWTQTTFEGNLVTGFERIMAVFPQRSGRIEIGPFLHRLTYQRGSERTSIELSSPPITIDVRPKPVIDGWWLPVRGLRVTDSWDRPPDQLTFGELASRTVTLEVHGVGPEILPPAPPMRSPGIMSFSDPEQRSHELTPEGPVSRVTWRWTVRPMTSTPAILEPVRIPWFDTRTREARETVIAQQRVALAGSAPVTPAPGSVLSEWGALALPTGLLIGLAAGLVLLVPGLRFRSRAELAGLFRRVTPDPTIKALRRAVRAGDAGAVRFAAHGLVRRDREEGRYESPGPKVEAGLTRLDHALFGPSATGPDVDLVSLLRDLLRARRLPASALGRPRRRTVRPIRQSREEQTHADQPFR